MSLLLQRQIECAKTRTGEDERDRHDEKQNIIIYSIVQELAVFHFVSELDHEDDDIQKGGELGIEADHEKHRDKNLDIAIRFAITASTLAFISDFSIAKISKGYAKDEANEQRPDHRICEKTREKA